MGNSGWQTGAVKAAAAAPAPVSATETTTSASAEPYSFPTDRLKRMMVSEDKIPLVVVACGSFSPTTFLHLRMFELASDFAKSSNKYEMVGMYLSPVSDAYNKAGLARASHRLRMCELAIEGSLISLDPWEATQPDYVPTANVLDHFEHEINTVLGGIQLPDGRRRNIQVSLLAGADLLQTMSAPGVWSDADLDSILGKFGAIIVEREGTDTAEALAGLSKWAHKITIIPQTIRNDISSTKIRLFINRDMSIRWLVPDPVRQYIQEHRLYIKDKEGMVQNNEPQGISGPGTSSG